MKILMQGKLIDIYDSSIDVELPDSADIEANVTQVDGVSIVDIITIPIEPGTLEEEDIGKTIKVILE
jgi:hypothetical protein